MASPDNHCIQRHNRKKAKAISVVGGNGKKRWQAQIWSNTPRFYLRQDLCKALSLNSAESKKNLLESKWQLIFMKMYEINVLTRHCPSTL